MRYNACHSKVTKNQNTAVEQRYILISSGRRYPYGETRLTTGTIYTDKLFTGQREMSGLGIYHYQARFYSPKLGRFLSADTIVPGMSNPQALNRYTYVLGNPLRYTDPTGHMVACEDGDGCDHGYPSSPVPTSPSPNNPNDPTDDADDPNPNGLTAPQPSLGLSGGSTQESADNYNYSFGSSNLLLYQYYSWMFDVEITGQFGLIYANNSPLTIGLDPGGLNLRGVYYESNNGFNLNASTHPSLGYAQSLPHSAISSVTGINVNPINGNITSRVATELDGPITIQQTVTIDFTVRPMETGLATIAGGIVLTALIPGPVDDAGFAVGAYKLCEATGLCP